MAILKDNVIYIEDYLDSRPNRVRRPLKDFYDQFRPDDYKSYDDGLADLNRQIAKHKKETDIIEREIDEYQAEAEEASKKLKEELYLAGGHNGKD